MAPSVGTICLGRREEHGVPFDDSRRQKHSPTVVFGARGRRQLRRPDDLLGGDGGPFAHVAGVPETTRVTVWSVGVGLALRHTNSGSRRSGDGSPFDRVPADRDAGSHSLGDAPAAGCAKSKRPVQRRLQVHHLPIQSVLSEAGLGELDGVMIARAQGAADDLRFRWRR
jgi:hypothetical protein